MARKVQIAAEIEVAEGPTDSALQAVIADRLRTTTLILRVESVEVESYPEERPAPPARGRVNEGAPHPLG